MKRFMIVAILGLTSLSSGCSSYLSSDGPYQGRVIDRETKRPVAGAVVLAIWWKESASITSPIQSTHDVQETLTNKDGDFTFSGTSKFSFDPHIRIREPVFTIFKPGYEVIGERKLLPLEKEKQIRVQLRELATREERLKNLGRVSVANCDREKKCPNLIHLRDLEAMYLGLNPTDLTR